jgi:hypothetical protein
MRSCKNSHSQLCKRRARRANIIRFALILLVFIVYGIIVFVKFGTGGILIALVTWSFFVFCTPVADAGFLVDFPIRIITKLKMVYTEMIVWAIAFFINMYAFVFQPSVYDQTIILKLFYHILTQPFPFWGIIIISGVGTFLSIYFADELMDVAVPSKRKIYIRHVSKYRVIIFVFLIAFIIALYDFLIKKMGISIHL